MQPLMLIVPDVQDVYTPLQSDVIVPLSEVSLNGKFCTDQSLFDLFISLLLLLQEKQ